MAHTTDLATSHASAKPPDRVFSKAEPGLAKAVTADQILRQEIQALIPRLTNYARVLTRNPVAADDLVQDCLARALGKIDLWERGTDLRAWLFTILHNQYINLARRRVRHHRFSIEVQRSHSGMTSAPNQHVRLELRDVERAIAKLSEDQRSVIRLIGLEGMQYEEAASVANIPLGTVRSRIARARRSLRTMTDQFPGADTRCPGVPANAGSPQFQTNRDRFRPIPTKPVSRPKSQEVVQ